MAFVGKGTYKKLKREHEALSQRVGSEVSLLHDVGTTVLYIAGVLESSEKGSILVVVNGKAVRSTGYFADEGRSTGSGATSSDVSLTFNEKSHILTYALDDPSVYRLELRPDWVESLDRKQGDPDGDQFRFCSATHLERYVNGVRAEKRATIFGLAVDKTKAILGSDPFLIGVAEVGMGTHVTYSIQGKDVTLPAVINGPRDVRYAFWTVPITAQGYALEWFIIPDEDAQGTALSLNPGALNKHHHHHDPPAFAFDFLHGDVTVPWKASYQKCMTILNGEGLDVQMPDNKSVVVASGMGRMSIAFPKPYGVETISGQDMATYTGHFEVTPLLTTEESATTKYKLFGKFEAYN